MLSQVAVACESVIFATWVLLTVAFQIDKLSVKIAHYDPFRLIPRWTFFSPNPGDADIHLVYRDLDEAGSKSAWMQVDRLRPGDSLPPFWNPYKRLAKLVWDAWTSMQAVCRHPDFNEAYLPITAGYVVLLNVVMGDQGDSRFPYRQFALLRSRGFENRSIEPLFVSRVHRRI